MADPASEVDGERPNPKSRHPILGDTAVREALALLFDRKSVQDFVYGRAGVATANFLNNPARFNSPNIKDEFSVDKANAVLDAAGWKRGADGIREKNGKKMKLLSSRPRSTRCARRCRASTSSRARRPASSSS